ncbi:MAG: hypothetical protein WBA37_08330 [Xanthobacteraceae bacterium]
MTEVRRAKIEATGSRETMVCSLLYVQPTSIAHRMIFEEQKPRKEVAVILLRHRLGDSTMNWNFSEGFIGKWRVKNVDRMVNISK